MLPITWEPHEAENETPSRRANAAARAAAQVGKDYAALENEAARALVTRLQTMRTSLQTRLLSQLTDFQRFTVGNLLADVDRLIAEAMGGTITALESPFKKSADLGGENVTQPLEAAKLRLVTMPGMPGTDQALVQAAFGNAVDLLSPPMQQFATDVKVAVRRVGLAGENRHVELQRLQKLIQGQGFDNAAYRAERIIRTEMARVFNGATYARLVIQAKEFPFLRKGWRATKDRRTRLGHVQAGQTYARGQGIPIGQLFQVNVYDERKGKTPKLIGVASLRYPVDPEATPAGRIAAGATIQCRCNAFVDMDLVAFTNFTRSQVTMALGNVAPPPAPPAPVPAAPPLPKPKKPPMVRPKPAKLAAPKPVVAKGLPAAKVPDPVQSGPQGPKVSEALDIKTAMLRKQIQAALAEIDKVHGDGVLPKIPVNLAKSRTSGAAFVTTMNVSPRALDRTRRAHELQFGKQLMKDAPFTTVFHETGHFIDFSGIGGDHYFGTEATGNVLKGVTAGQQQAFSRLMDALRGSKAVQVLKEVQTAMKPRHGTGWGSAPYWAPNGMSLTQVDYMLEGAEVFARAYAQYMARKSGNPAALAEVRNMQKAARGLVEKTAANYKKHYGMGLAPADDTWDYPWTWQDEDFAEIETAMDDLFKALGWRK